MERLDVVKDIKTVYCDSKDLSHTILLYQKKEFDIDYVYKYKADRYEVQLSKQRKVI